MGNGSGIRKFHLTTCHEGTEMDRRHSSLFNLGPRWGCDVNPKPRPLYPPERPGTYYVRGWVDPTADLDRCGMSPPPTGILDHPQKLGRSIK